jgi:hypothetical protein
MAGMSFQKATRKKVFLRMALFGPSGAGKTMSALRIGSGIAAKVNSRMAVVDTERGSAQLYANRFDFDTLDLEDHRVESYRDALHAAAKAGYRVVVIDSLSHGWQSLLEEVDRQAAKMGGNTWAAWSKGTPKQRMLVDAILSYPGHIVATMRSKTQWEVTEKNGKKQYDRIGTEVVQGKGIEYEFTLMADINTDHALTFIKDRTGKFQDRHVVMPGEALGEELVDWLMEGEGEPEAVAPHRSEPAPEPEPRREERPAAREDRRRDPEPAPAQPERVDVLAFIDRTRAGAVKAYKDAAEKAKAEGADVEGAKLEECPPAWGCINGMVSDAIEAGTITPEHVQDDNGKRSNSKCVGLVKAWIEADPKGMKEVVRAYYASKVEERRATLAAMVEALGQPKAAVEKSELAAATA